jgi:hypothetical protein
MSSLKFSGHQSFSFRNSWLTKGIYYLNKYPDLFRRDDAMVILGVGKNMVSSIRHWCTVCQLITSQRKDGKSVDLITKIGDLLFINENKIAWDPYLEDTGTLWLIHYLYATHEEYYTTAYHVFNHLNASQFTRNELVYQLQQLAKKLGVKASVNTISRDVNTFIHTYAGSIYSSNQEDYEDTLDCPLKELGIVSHNSGEDLYFIDRSPKNTLPDGIFLFIVQDFIKDLDQSTISVEELFYSPRSPGRVLRLDETSLIERLEKFDELSSGRLVLSETAGIRQILINEQADPTIYLARYYNRMIEDNNETK